MKLSATSEMTPRKALAKLGFGPQSWVLQMLIGLHTLDACRFDAFVSKLVGINGDGAEVTISTVDAPHCNVVFHDIIAGNEIEDAMDPMAWGAYFKTGMWKAIPASETEISHLKGELEDAQQALKSLKRCFETLDMKSKSK